MISLKFPFRMCAGLDLPNHGRLVLPSQSHRQARQKFGKSGRTRCLEQMHMRTCPVYHPLAPKAGTDTMLLALEPSATH